MRELSPTSNFSPAIRRLHFAVAILVTTQLVIGLTMSPKHTPELFLSHQLIGLTIAALVLLHWLWLFSRERDQLAHLVPLRAPALRAVGCDLRGLLHGRMPAGGPRPGLPALIHGLGLLALTTVAGLGTGIYVLIRLHHTHSEVGKVLSELHVIFAWVVIVYWCGHVLLALVHEATGDHVIARMLKLGSGADSGGA
ncbi:MAG: cytochrome b/b6 domain-containing protein [Gammaproteobacteria bacterium]